MNSISKHFCVRIIVLAGLCAPMIACDSGIRIENVAPMVTAIGPVIQLAEGDVRMFLWIRDYEEDPVDAQIILVNDDGSQEPLSITGGHLSVGLTTNNDATGAPHELIWTPPDSINEPIQLRVTVTDWKGGESVETLTPSFFLADGLPTP